MPTSELTSNRAQADDRGLDSWPELKPLSGSLAEVPRFDPDLMAESLRGRVVDLAERFQLPPDYPAATLIAMLAGAIGRRAFIRPKQNDNWRVYPNLWGGIVGRSGVMNTPLLNDVLGPLRRRQTFAMMVYESELDEYERRTGDFGTRKRVRRAVLAGRYKNSGDDEPFDAEVPQAPICTRYLINDTSVEKLHLLLRDNPAGLMLLRDELAGWIGQVEKANRMRAFFLETWSGDGEFTFDRVGRGSVYAGNLCLSVFGGIQPGPLQAYVSAARGGAGDDGFLQRFQLLVWPEVSREWEEIDRAPDVRAERRVEDILARILRLSPDDPLRTRFSPAAQERFRVWRADLERKIRSGTLAAPLESHLAKARSVMPKLALILHLCESDGWDGEISLTQANRAIQLCEYLERHARRVYGSVASLPQRLAASLAQKLRSGALGEHFTLRDVYLHGWAGLDTAERARAAVAVLVEAGWLRRSRTAVGRAGGRPSEEYSVNPAIHQKERTGAI